MKYTKDGGTKIVDDKEVAKELEALGWVKVEKPKKKKKVD